MFIATTLVVAASICGDPVTLKITTFSEKAGIQVIAQLPDELRTRFKEGVVEPKAASAVLKFCLVDQEPGPAVFGKYERKNNTLVFTPRYRLANGQLYRAFFSLPKGKLISVDYRARSQPQRIKPQVVRTYPSGDLLPANQLKFYIYFSKPMREGRAIFDQIHLRNSRGVVLPDTWRRTELWSSDARRLTLWIHPGRVKRGVNLREEFGPVLEADKSYSLVVTANVQDANGATINDDFVKKFRTTEADYRRPLPQRWKLTTPPAETKQPVAIDFGEAIDHALAVRLLEVWDADDQQVSGKATLTDHESKWRFQPDTPWSHSQYQVKVNDLLEDLAGNTPARVFDRDLQKSVGPKPKLELRFEPK